MKNRILMGLLATAMAAGCGPSGEVEDPGTVDGSSPLTEVDGGSEPEPTDAGSQMESDAGQRDAGAQVEPDAGSQMPPVGGGSQQPPADGGTKPDGGMPNPLTSPSVPEVQAACVDGRYAERLPETGANIAPAVSAYAPANAVPFLQQVLTARYPLGAKLVTDSVSISPQNCLDLFLDAQSKQSAAGVLRRASTVVHECGHLLDIYSTTAGKSVYVFTEALRFQCSGLSYAGTDKSFARSRILNDTHGALRPPCPAQGANGCDSYAKIYLDGNPDDATFQGGDQGFNTVLEETLQYVNSLAVDHAFSDQLPTGQKVSAKDGLLTFLWYLERYLQLARTTYPMVHQRILQDACWRNATLNLWGRAWLYLEHTAANGKLGIDDAKLLPLVRTPALLAEIEYLRAAASCTSGN